MDNFLKYQILFLGFGINQKRFDGVKELSNGFIGAHRNSYYFKVMLT